MCRNSVDRGVCHPHHDHGKHKKPGPWSVQSVSNSRNACLNFADVVSFKSVLESAPVFRLARHGTFCRRGIRREEAHLEVGLSNLVLSGAPAEETVQQASKAQGEEA